MPTVKGRDQVKRFIASIPGQLEEKVLRGAAREAAKVIAEEAKARSISSNVDKAIRVDTVVGNGRIVGRVQVRGKGAHIAPWLEYGTDPHFITVDDSQRQGMTANRINKLAKSGTLVISGKPVGKTVFHPGARPHPFLRPALDAKAVEAVAAAQSYINARVTREGIVGTDQGDDE